MKNQKEVANIVVINKAARCIALAKGPMLVPGSNMITESQAKKFEKAIENHKDLECELEEKLTGGSPLELNVKKATAIIENMNDEDVLKGWLEEEKAGKNRAGVIQAIEAQMQVIEASIDRKDQ